MDANAAPDPATSPRAVAAFEFFLNYVKERGSITEGAGKSFLHAFPSLLCVLYVVSTVIASCPLPTVLDCIDCRHPLLKRCL